MPVQYIDSSKEKAEVQSEIRRLLKEFHDQTGGMRGAGLDPTDRMKPLDVVKVMMGVYSERATVKRFMNNSRVWAKYQENDYEELYKLA